MRFINVICIFSWCSVVGFVFLLVLLFCSVPFFFFLLVSFFFFSLSFLFLSFVFFCFFFSFLLFYFLFIYFFSFRISYFLFSCFSYFPLNAIEIYRMIPFSTCRSQLTLCQLFSFPFFSDLPSKKRETTHKLNYLNQRLLRIICDQLNR